MGVNEVSNNFDTYGIYGAINSTNGNVQEPVCNVKQGSGVIYEMSPEAGKKISETDRRAIVARLKMDQETRVTQMVNLVRQMMEGQGAAYGQANDIWEFLAGGEFTVDARTKARALEDISEDGYWGVWQTSERIYNFALALSGGDETQMEKMREAFKKGFTLAAGSWGKELPEISKNTYDAVMKKFDEKELSENQ